MEIRLSKETDPTESTTPAVVSSGTFGRLVRTVMVSAEVLMYNFIKFCQHKNLNETFGENFMSYLKSADSQQTLYNLLVNCDKYCSLV